MKATRQKIMVIRIHKSSDRKWINTKYVKDFKVSATLKIGIFPYLRFQRFQIDMPESFLLKQKSDENIISVERYRG